MSLPELKAGIYRHYKGPLYLVQGYSHDASIEGRINVVYIGLQLDDAHTGPRLANREQSEFHQWVWPETGEHLTPLTYESVEHEARTRKVSVEFALREGGYVPRFEFVGYSYQPGMTE